MTERRGSGRGLAARTRCVCLPEKAKDEEKPLAQRPRPVNFPLPAPRVGINRSPICKIVRPEHKHLGSTLIGQFPACIECRD